MCHVGCVAKPGRRKKPPVEQEQLTCLKIVRRIMPFREALLCFQARSGHGNIRLELLDALIVLLAGFFNPIARSTRLIEILSQMPWVQGQLKVDRVCRSTLSDAFTRFDPEELVPLINALMDQVPNLRRADQDLATLCKQIIAADGSMFTLAADVVWALHHAKRNGKSQGQCRLNLQLDIDHFTPVDLSVSGQDEGSEAAAFISRLHRGVIYLIDRNFVHFEFLNEVLSHESDFVLRLRTDTRFQAHRPIPLSAKDVESGVISDQAGVLPGGKAGRTGPPPEQLLREVVIVDPLTGKPIRLLTSLLDVPAHGIGLLYRHRWQVELFLRWLKVWAGFEHLISHSRNGITIQFYVAVIACLLMHISTGYKVNKYMLFLMGQVTAGLIGFDQILPMLDRIEREKQQQRKRRERKKLLKNPPRLPG